MASLNPIVDWTAPITRQTLHDMWTGAKLSTLTSDDLSPELFPIEAQDSAPSEAPGKIWWNTLEQVAYVYTDELENTGVSLWLAFGPDRLETACLAAEPIGPGAVVEAHYDRWVKVATAQKSGGGALGDGIPRLIGINQSGVHIPLNAAESSTAASGTWIRVGIDGIMNAYLMDDPGTSSAYYSHSQDQFLAVDDRNDGHLINTQTLPVPDFSPICAATLYSFTNTAQSEPGFAQFYTMRWLGPRKTRVF